MTAMTFGAIHFEGAAVERLSSLLCLSLLHFLWQAAAIGVAAFIVGFVLKHRSARGEYLALVLGLLSLPVVFAATIAWQRAKCPPPVPAQIESRAVVAATSPKILDTAPQRPQAEVVLLIADANGKPSPAPIAAPLAPAPQKKWDWHPFAPWLGGVYLLEVAAMFLRLLVGLSGARRLAREAARIDDGNIFELLAALCRRIGLAAMPRLASCRDVSVPTLVGIVWPTILLPLSAIANLSPAELESILLHELVHIRRHDHLVNLVQRSVESLFFFHPAVWLLSRRITTVREHCCDDAVLALGANQSVYIDSLLRVAELGLANQSTAVGAPVGIQATGNGSRLRRRITRLLGEPRRTSLRLKPLAMAVAAICLVGTISAPLLLTTFAAAQRAGSDSKSRAPKPKITTVEQPLQFNGTVFDKRSRKPVAGAIVMVHRWHRNEVEPTETSETIADSAGRYSFTISPEEAKSLVDIQIDARAPGFAPRPGPCWDFKGIAQSIAQSTEHEHHEDVELLAGQTVSAVAEAPDGRPLAKCQIYFVSSTPPAQSRIDTLTKFVDGLRSDTLWRMLKIPPNAYSEGNTTTDANGRFSFEAIFGASHAEFCIQPQKYVPLWHDCGTDRGDFGTFRVRPGIRFSGSVVDETGSPLKNAEVDIAMEYAGGVVSLRRGGFAHTDDHGHFELGPVDPGAYWFSVDDSRFLPVRAIALASNPNATVYIKPPALTTVCIHFVDRNGKPRTNRHGASLWAGDDTFPDSDQPGLAWMYFPLTQYRTRFHWDGSAVVARVPQQREDSYADLHCASLDDWDGWYYRLAGMHDHWNLEGDGSGFVRMPRITGDSLDATVVEAKLPSLTMHVVGPDGKPVSQFSHRLEYANASLNKPVPRQPSGRKPVKLDLSKAPPQYRASFAPLYSMLSSGGFPASNEFKFDAIQPDEQFTITISGGGSKPVSQTFNLKEGEHREATIKLAAAKQKPGGDATKSSAVGPAPVKTAPEQSSAPPFEFRGTVSDESNNKPIAGATVEIRMAEPGALVGLGLMEHRVHWSPALIRTTTDAAGKYRGGLPPEFFGKRYLMSATATHPDYLPPDARIWRAVPNPTDSDNHADEWIDLLPAKKVSGIVVDQLGHPVPNCEITISSAGKAGANEQTKDYEPTMTAHDTAATDKRGRFTARVMHGATSARITISSNDFTAVRRAISPTDPNAGTFHLTPGTRVTGSVVDGVGKPVEFEMLAMSPIGEHQPVRGMNMSSVYARELLVSTDRVPAYGNWASTDANGRFSFNPVANGRYQIDVLDRMIPSAGNLGSRFLPVAVDISSKNPPSPIAIHGLPLVDVRLHFVNRAGRALDYLNTDIDIHGTANGHDYSGHFYWGDEVTTARVPIGLQNVKIDGYVSGDGIIAWRIGDRGDLHLSPKSGVNIHLDSIKDATDISVVLIKPAEVRLRAVGDDGKPAAGAQPRIDYSDKSLKGDGPPLFVGDVAGDVSMQQLFPGTWQTYRLIPDHEFSLTVHAAGFQTSSQSMKLAEGESREITVRLAADTKSR